MRHSFTTDTTGRSQWNDVCERRNGTLLDMVPSMMGQADLTITFWGQDEQ